MSLLNMIYLNQVHVLICMERNSTGLASNSGRCAESLLKQATILKGFMMFGATYY
jgi:hypothetical protein